MEVRPRCRSGVDQVFRGGLWEEGIQPLEAKGAARVLGEECFQQRNLEGEGAEVGGAWWAGTTGKGSLRKEHVSGELVLRTEGGQGKPGSAPLAT